MTCLQAVNRGNASAPGTGRGAGVGGLSGHLCARMAGSRVRGKGVSLGPCLGHGSGCGCLGVRRHCACVRDREELGDKTEQKRANTDLVPPSVEHGVCTLHLIYSEPPFCR